MLIFITASILIASVLGDVKISRWEPVPGGNCNNETDHFDSDSGVAYMGTGSWDHLPGVGWRWCGVTVEKCEDSCEAIGDCNRFFYTHNGCCYPSKITGKSCNGAPGGGGQMWALTPVRFEMKPGGNCNLDKDQYDKSSGGPLAPNWGYDPQAGWRWCHMSLAACQKACSKLKGCKAIYHTPDNCCFPHESDDQCHGSPGGKGGKKYVVVSNAGPAATLNEVSDKASNQHVDSSSFYSPTSPVILVLSPSPAVYAILLLLLSAFAACRAFLVFRACHARQPEDNQRQIVVDVWCE